MANKRKFDAAATTGQQRELAATLAAQVIEEGAQTHSLSFPDKTWDVIEELAKQNTGGNKSRLLQMLVHQAAMIPDAFGFKLDDDPKGAPASANPS